MRHKNHQVDLCVVGGGLAGMCTSIAAARLGIKVALIQDRPVFGGNSSSEIRMSSTGGDVLIAKWRATRRRPSALWRTSARNAARWRRGWRHCPRRTATLGARRARLWRRSTSPTVRRLACTPASVRYTSAAWPEQNGSQARLPCKGQSTEPLRRRMDGVTVVI